MASKLHLAIDDIVDRIRTPIQWIGRAATWTRTAAPFIGKDYLAAIIVEGRRVPIGKTRVNYLIQAHWIQWIGNIQQDAVAGTGPCSQTNFGKGGDIVTLAGNASALGVVPVIAALPQTGDDARFRVRKDMGTIDDACLLGSRYWNLDHVDGKELRFGVLEG